MSTTIPDRVDLTTVDSWSEAAVGAAWRRFDETGRIRASAVVLAARGFVMNQAMLEQYTPDLAVVQTRGMAGLRVTPDGELVTAEGSVVPGIYAAVACASNIAVDGHDYSSGTLPSGQVQLGEASFFGRRAGRHAALMIADQAAPP